MNYKTIKFYQTQAQSWLSAGLICNMARHVIQGFEEGFQKGN